MGEHALSGYPGLSTLEQESDEITPLLGCHGFGNAIGHQGACVLALFDVGFGDFIDDVGSRITQHNFGCGFLINVSFQDLSIVDGNNNGFVPLLHFTGRPEDRFDEGFGSDAGTYLGQIGANGTTLLANLVTGDAGELGIAEDNRPTPNIAVLPGRSKHFRYQCWAILELLLCRLPRRFKSV